MKTPATERYLAHLWTAGRAVDAVGRLVEVVMKHRPGLTTTLRKHHDQPTSAAEGRGLLQRQEAVATETALELKEAGNDVPPTFSQLLAETGKVGLLKVSVEPTCEPSGLTNLQFEPVPDISTTPPAEETETVAAN
ncbi:hypothetical protein EYF80_004605 [Liparis tanakae]|uniref:Uncharacterized protein n=1 Tax=Liparis tanakae TaxID=230148 RepID=A0A4Z2J4H3_9TELE|nr:hypothetical protein EYF80_004605 [Liparis tanakae]